MTADRAATLLCLGLTRMRLEAPDTLALAVMVSRALELGVDMALEQIDQDPGLLFMPTLPARWMSAFHPVGASMLTVDVDQVRA